METIISIIAVLLIAFNLPMAVALCMGVRLHTTSTCEEDIRSVKHNRIMLKSIAVADVCLGLALFVASLCLG